MSDSMGSLALTASATLALSALSGVQTASMGVLSLTAPATLALGTLAGVEVSEGSASLGALSLTASSTLSLGTLSGAQNGDMGALGLTAGATLALGILEGVEVAGGTNASMGALGLTAPATLALGTLASGSPVLDAPTLSPVIPGDGVNTLTWSAVSGAGVSSYRIYWTSDGSNPTKSSSVITPVSSPYQHIGLTNGITYKYAVTASDAANQKESALSNVLSGTPAGASLVFSDTFSEATIDAAKWNPMVVTGSITSPAASIDAGRLKFTWSGNILVGGNLDMLTVPEFQVNANMTRVVLTPLSASPSPTASYYFRIAGSLNSSTITLQNYDDGEMWGVLVFLNGVMSMDIAETHTDNNPIEIKMLSRTSVQLKISGNTLNSISIPDIGPTYQLGLVAGPWSGSPTYFDNVEVYQ